MNEIKMTAIVPWTDCINSTPIDDMRSAQNVCGKHTGWYGHEFEMNNNTMLIIGLSKQYQGYVDHLENNNINIDLFLSLMWGYGEPVSPLATKKNSCNIDEKINDGEVIVKYEKDFAIKYIGF